jgi:hypothetical protein
MEENPSLNEGDQLGNTRLTNKDALEIVKYIDGGREVVMEWLDKNPNTPLPSGLVAALMRSQTSSIHASHHPRLRRFHDAWWQEKYGDTIHFPKFTTGEGQEEE